MDKHYPGCSPGTLVKCDAPQKIRFFFLAIIVLVISSAPAGSAVFAVSHPQVGYSDRLASYLQAQMETYHIPGMSVAILRDGEVEHMNGLGVANSAGGPVTPDTPFLLASLSKSITAAGIMQLVEQGRLNLDDRVQQYLPWFEVAGGQGGDITVEHLLYQTSGLSDLAGQQANLAPDSPDALEAGVRGLQEVELVFNPGEDYQYSNLNYSVLGLLIQEISGQPYEAYIQEHILTPLGMLNSYTSMSSARANGAASGFYPFFGFPLVMDRSMPYTRLTLPSAGLWSSASDMSRYLLALLDGGKFNGVSLLSEDSIRLLEQPGHMFDDRQGYAMGWTSNQGYMPRDQLVAAGSSLKDRGELVVLFHEGDWVGYKSVAFLLPELEYGLVLLMNSNDPTVTSALRFMAWDVTLIATGGEAQYFPPSEEFIVRRSRLVFSLLILVLVLALLWLISVLRRPHTGESTGRKKALIFVAIILLGILALNGYVLLKLMPDQNVSLPILFRFTPDLGILMILYLLLSLAWVVACVVLFISLRRPPRDWAPTQQGV